MFPPQVGFTKEKSVSLYSSKERLMASLALIQHNKVMRAFYFAGGYKKSLNKS
jgi:hypothetical protein